jgi:hypothetical protein
MARIRTIKPEFFSSADIVALTPLARLLFIAFWCESDREGRMVWRPETFKLRYLAGDNCNISALCKEITGRGLVVLYGDGFAHIPTFSTHQHINPRESVSRLPEPDAITTRDSRVGTRANQDVHAQVGREGKGKEGKGKEGEKTARVALAPDGVPEPVWQDFLKVRKAKRLPMTDTAWQGITREAAKAGIDLAQAVTVCCERGWATFNAGWYADSAKQHATGQRQSPNKQEALEARNRALAEEMIAEFNQKNGAEIEAI